MTVSDIAPPGPVARNVGVSALVKARYGLLGCFPSHRGPLVAFVRERINSIMKLLTALQGLLTGSLQANVRIGA